MMSSTTNNNNIITQKTKTNNSTNAESAYTTALLRSMEFSGVQFLRYLTVDSCNNLRSKVKPIKHLLRSGATTLNDQVSIASICYAGLPSFADAMVEGSGMDAKHVLIVQPDLKTFRNLPYAPKTATVIGNLVDQYSNEPSPLCSRTLLQNVVDKAAREHNIAFNVGVELEFCLVDAATGKFPDNSLFANTTTLNQQEDFISDLYTQLEQQYIPIELIHSESGPGQLEMVLQYSTDPVTIADNVLLAQETIRAVARKHGFKALFAPKYDMMKAGSGMHVHMSIRDATTGQPLFVKQQQQQQQGGNAVMDDCSGSSAGSVTASGLSKQGEAFMEGILNHLPALMGLSLPTVNSFRRVGKGCWTGSVVGWALEDKESGVRVCSNLATKEWDHVEYKLCDATCNLYIALSGLLTAGMEGIQQKLSLRPAIGDNNQAGGSGGGHQEEAALPGSVMDAFTALEKDEMLMNMIGSRLGQGYLALRRADAERCASMTVEEEVAEFLSRA